jgi:SepF-like predicted cell division protein (DUF552 family)
MRFPWSKKDDEIEHIEEYTELPMDLEEPKPTKIIIDKLESYADVDLIMKKVRDGNIVIAKIKELKESNLDELKQAIAKMKTACANFDGDIAGVGDEWIILTPRTAKIHREEAVA